MPSTLKLIIGNKNYSSWSLRSWLVLRHFEIPFEELRVPLRVPETRKRLLEFSRSAKVPVLIDDPNRIWDSISIIEYLAESFPERRIWPSSKALRAEARSICAEMHSGFAALRAEMPLNCRASDRRVQPTAELRSDVARVVEIWGDLRTRFAGEGPWLFGQFCAADAMFAPVALRFDIYGTNVDEPAQSFISVVLDDSHIQDWVSAAREEPEILPDFEAGSVDA